MPSIAFARFVALDSKVTVLRELLWSWLSSLSWGRGFCFQEEFSNSIMSLSSSSSSS